MSIYPLGDKLVVELDPVVKETPSGLVLPDSAQTSTSSAPREGTVVTVGDGRIVDGKTIPVSIEVGTRVLFARYAGVEIERMDDGTKRKYVILSESELLAVIKA